ncbi:diacylglycerol kinase family lipid kinase [Pseudoteredinibacter isoporae]
MICNPISGYSDKHWLKALCERLDHDAYPWARYDTQAGGDATRFLAEETWQADLIIVAGGDGTINEVASGLYAAGRLDVPVLPLSTGTANVLARELGINGLASSHKIDKIMALIADSPTRRVHLPLINGKVMLLMAGVGFDAWVVHTLDSNLKKRMGKLAYVVSMLKQVPKASRRLYRVISDGKNQTVNAAIISNGRFYAGSYTLCPNGMLEESDLVITTISGNTLTFILALCAMPLGLMHKCPGVEQFSAQEVSIEALNEAEEPVQLDGDDFGLLPCTVRCSEHSIEFLHR